MSPKYKASLMSLVLVVLSLAAAQPTYADAIQLFSYAQLGPGSTTVTYPGIPGDTFSPALIVSAGGNTVSITDNNNVLQRVNQSDGWNGNFAVGERLLWTGVSNNNPMTITFANGITEFGLQAQTAVFVPETFTFDVFNGATLIQTFTIAGVSSPLANDSATFLGARAFNGDVITRIVINNMSSQISGNFAINEVTFNGNAPTAVPEPTTMLLLGTGLFGLAAKVRKRRKNKAN